MSARLQEGSSGAGGATDAGRSPMTGAEPTVRSRSRVKWLDQMQGAPVETIADDDPKTAAASAGDRFHSNAWRVCDRMAAPSETPRADGDGARVSKR